MTKTESGVTPWEDRESLYENTLFSQVERMEAEIAELRARLAATTQASTAQAEPVITRADVSKAQADAIQGFAESLLEMGIVEQSVHDTAMKIVAHLRSAGDTGEQADGGGDAEH